MGCREEVTGNKENITLFAFVDVNLVPMTEELILEDQTVVIEGERIMLIGDSVEVKVPHGATVIDGDGAYLMPGLADMHVHIYEESREEYPISPLSLYIAKGVTTIRDCGTAPISHSDTFVLDWRDEILSGEATGPMIYSSGRTIHGPLSNPAEIVRKRHADGFDFVKLYMELSIDEFEAAQTTAEELGMFTVGHIPYQVGYEKSSHAGLDEIAHLEELSFELMWSNHRPTRLLSVEGWLSSLIGAVVDDYSIDLNSDINFDSSEFNRLQGDTLNRVLSDMQIKDIAIGTSLGVYEVVDQKIFHQDQFLNRPEIVYLPQEFTDILLNGQDKHVLMYQMLGENADIWNWKRDLDTYLLQRLHESNVILVAGTDSGSTNIGVVEGFSMHEELRILTENGFTPYEALQTATINAATIVEKMTGSGDFGTIEIGKRADLVLVAGNPLEDITNTQNILGVMARGRWYPQNVLIEMIVVDD